MSNKKLEAPIFTRGQVIDINYIHGGLPNRIRIDKIWADHKYDGWKYDVLIESTNEIQTMAESFIKERTISKYAPIYQLPVIVTRYNEGWRFAGNYKESDADKKMSLYKDVSHVKNIRYTEAYTKTGKLLPGYVAIWVRYHNPISNSGDVDYTQGSMTFVKDIK